MGGAARSRRVEVVVVLLLLLLPGSGQGRMQPVQPAMLRCNALATLLRLPPLVAMQRGEFEVPARAWSCLVPRYVSAQALPPAMPPPSETGTANKRRRVGCMRALRAACGAALAAAEPKQLRRLQAANEEGTWRPRGNPFQVP